MQYALLLAVVLGISLQPLLRAVGELHDVEHTVAVQSEHGHAHHDGHDEPVGDEDASGDPIGAHNLLHDAGFAASMALLDLSLRVVSPLSPGDAPASIHAQGPPIAPLTFPFRPPIA